MLMPFSEYFGNFIPKVKNGILLDNIVANPTLLHWIATPERLELNV
jgi:hypothetical protein